MIEYFLNPQSIEALGWTLLHSLWQGAAFAIFLVLILIALRSYSAHARYIVSVGVLCAFFLTLSTTFWLQWQEASSQVQLTDAYMNQESGDETYVLNERTGEVFQSDAETITMLPSNSEVMENGESSLLISFRDYYQRHLPLLVTIWFLGVLVLQLRFLGQLAYVQRLKHYGTQLFPTAWSDRIEELEGKLRIQKKVQYLTSLRIESPMVIGWLKPVVLMPQQLLTSLTETEIYAVLAHELAHIRREDFIVNLLQTFLCNVFFFHPGVWWMSNRIDDEREHCCDDLAVAATGPATSYAKTLINVSELQLKLQGNPQLALALTGKSNKRERGGFTDRIRRLFMVNNGAGTFREGFATAIILVTALFLGVAATGSTVQDADTAVNSEMVEPGNISNNENSNSLDLNLNTNITSTAGNENYTNSIIDQVDLNGLPVADPAEPSTQLPIARPFPNPRPSGQEGAVQPDQPRIDALVMACKEGDFDFVKTLIKSGININSIGSDGFTPLMMATSQDEEEIVAYLLKQGADVNQNFNSWTALIEAADEDALKSMKHLLNAGADVNYYQNAGSPTAISMAASEGHLECLKLLLDYGADIDGVGKSVPPLHLAAEEDKREVIAYLLAQNAIVNRKDVAGRTALMYAASEGHKKSVIKLIEAGADISIRDINGATARDYAEREDQYGIRDYLGTSKRPEIHQATLDGLMEKVQRMVEGGMNVNAIDDVGRTPLHIASAMGYTNDMLTLINLGANINAQDKQGRTPLMYAAADGLGDAVALLVSRQASVNIIGVDGKRALEWALAGRHSDLANFLGLITEKKSREEINASRKNSRAHNSENRASNARDRSQSYEQRIENQVQKQVERQVQKIIQKENNKNVHTNVVTDVDNNIRTNMHTDVNIGNRKQSVIQNPQKEAFHVAANGTHLRQFNLNTITPALVEVARNGSIEDLRQLLHNELDINAADATGQTALMAAASRNRLDIAKVLIQNMADVNQSSASGLTALHYAALENYDEMAQLLLRNNAFVDVTMQYSVTDDNFNKDPLVWEYIGATPLLVAVEAGSTKVISVLIDAGADRYQSLTRKEYKLIKNRFSNTKGGEVIINKDFLKDVASQTSDDTWTPYKHALSTNKSKILALFK